MNSLIYHFTLFLLLGCCSSSATLFFDIPHRNTHHGKILFTQIIHINVVNRRKTKKKFCYLRAAYQLCCEVENYVIKKSWWSVSAVFLRLRFRFYVAERELTLFFRYNFDTQQPKIKLWGRHRRRRSLGIFMCKLLIEVDKFCLNWN